MTESGIRYNLQAFHNYNLNNPHQNVLETNHLALVGPRYYVSAYHHSWHELRETRVGAVGDGTCVLVTGPSRVHVATVSCLRVRRGARSRW